jgi:hypothetical protein
MCSNAELGGTTHRASGGGTGDSDAEGGWARHGWRVSASHTPFTTRDISRLIQAKGFGCVTWGKQRKVDKGKQSKNKNVNTVKADKKAMSG